MNDMCCTISIERRPRGPAFHPRVLPALVATLLVGVSTAAAASFKGRNVVVDQSAYVRLSQGGGVVGTLYRNPDPQQRDDHDWFFVASKGSRLDDGWLWGYADGRYYKGCGWIRSGNVRHSSGKQAYADLANRECGPPRYTRHDSARVSEYKRLSFPIGRSTYGGGPKMCKFDMSFVAQKTFYGNYTELDTGYKVRNRTDGQVNAPGHHTPPSRDDESHAGALLAPGDETHPPTLSGEVGLRYVARRAGSDGLYVALVKRKHVDPRWGFIKMTRAELKAIVAQKRCAGMFLRAAVAAQTPDVHTLEAPCTDDSQCGADEVCGDADTCQACRDDACDEPSCTGLEPETDPLCGWFCEGDCEPEPGSCESPGSPWECQRITCADAHLFTGYSPLHQDLQNPIALVHRDEVYPVHGMENESYAARIKYGGSEYYIQRAYVELPPAQCTSPGAPWECRAVTCRDARVFTGYSPTNHDLQNPVGTVRVGEVYPTHEMTDEDYAARIVFRGQYLYVLRSCVYPPRTYSCSTRCCDNFLEENWRAASEGGCLAHASALCAPHHCRGANHVRFDGRLVLEKGCDCCAKCAARDNYYKMSGVCGDCTAEARQWCAVGDRGGLDDAKWGECALPPGPPPTTPPPTTPPPTTPPPQLCYTHCCDGREAEAWLGSRDQCWSWAGSVCGNVKINTIHFPKYNVIYNADGCRCCAKCNNRDASYNMGPFQDCTERARSWCAQGTRGGLANAFWGSSCPYPPN